MGSQPGRYSHYRQERELSGADDSHLKSLLGTEQKEAIKKWLLGPSTFKV